MPSIFHIYYFQCSIIALFPLNKTNKIYLETRGKIMLYKNFYDDLLCQYNELASTKNEIEKNLKNAPTGKIKITINRNHVQYYLRTTSSDKSGKYLRKSNIKLITKLLQKSYYEKALSLINKHFFFLKIFNQSSTKSKQDQRTFFFLKQQHKHLSFKPFGHPKTTTISR